MNISFPIICYLIREMLPKICENHPIDILYEQNGSPDLEIRHIRSYEDDTLLNSDTLYILPLSRLENICTDLPQESIQMLAVAENSKPTPDVSKTRSRKDNILICHSKIKPSLLLEHIQDMAQTVIKWDASFDRDILRQEDPKKLFSRGRELLFRDYAIIDLDMNVTYCTQGYAKSRSVKGARLSDELFQDLISHKEFHDAATKTGSFYYNNVHAGTEDLCHNIYVNKQYIARLVMILNEHEQTFHEGGKRIFECFTRHIQDVFIHMNLVPKHHTEDEMHRMCQAILGGKIPDQNTMVNILRTYTWNIDHNYIVVVLRFSVGKEWNPHLLIMLPHLAANLEGLWLHSCAVYNKEQIALIMNLSISYAAENYERFMQSLAYFVRDNVCKAGISPYFSDFSLLRSAYTAAEAALMIGSDQDPHFWYYHFEKYRLVFIKQALQKALPAPLLSHPAIDILEIYDRRHDSALTETLFVYLDSGRNATKSSEKLFIHRTSFIRRMNQIIKLTGLDLDDPDTVLALQLSYLLRK